jgi:hypothetical protein
VELVLTFLAVILKMLGFHQIRLGVIKRDPQMPPLVSEAGIDFKLGDKGFIG